MDPVATSSDVLVHILLMTAIVENIIVRIFGLSQDTINNKPIKIFITSGLVLQCVLWFVANFGPYPYSLNIFDKEYGGDPFMYDFFTWCRTVTKVRAIFFGFNYITLVFNLAVIIGRLVEMRQRRNKTD